MLWAQGRPSNAVGRPPAAHYSVRGPSPQIRDLASERYNATRGARATTVLSMDLSFTEKGNAITACRNTLSAFTIREPGVQQHATSRRWPGHHRTSRRRPEHHRRRQLTTDARRSRWTWRCGVLDAAESDRIIAPQRRWCGEVVLFRQCKGVPRKPQMAAPECRARRVWRCRLERRAWAAALCLE